MPALIEQNLNIESTNWIFANIHNIFLLIIQYKSLTLHCWNKVNFCRKNIEMKQVQNWALFLVNFYNKLNISIY